MLNIITAIAASHNLRKSGNRFTGPCPECGGKARSEKFSMYIDGGFICFCCGFHGDIITWLRRKEGKSCPEAHEIAGLPCRFDACQVKGTCRLGDGSGRRAAKKPKTIAPLPSPPDNDLTESVVKSPAALWLEWAENLAGRAMARLQSNPEQLAWLAARGISAEAADRFGLGWIGHDHKVKRDAIGLAPKDGKPELWVPGGLLIPIPSAGRLHRIRIRRTVEARARFLPDLKYVWIQGSGTEPLTIRPAGIPRGAVIVEAELDAFAVAAAHPEVMVVALGTVSAGVPAGLRRELAAVPVILVALDFDQVKDGKAGAGQKAFARWGSTFRQARYWPVPQGKDPGHYAELGGSLGTWVEAGLAPKIAAFVPGAEEVQTSPVFAAESAASHDLPLSPVLSTTGDRGEQTLTGPGPVELQRVAGLKWCCVCYGDKFIAGDAGGYFCVNCVPYDKPGRLVLATVPRGEYVVD